MCGIIAAVAKRDVADILLEGLQRLEYRGYDSAGIAIIDSEANFTRHRRLGKVQILADDVKEQNIKGGTGIAHTRWATHGVPSENNAHPHLSRQIALVHNGIIENHQARREDLIKKGYLFESETDTEVIAHLIDAEFERSGSLFDAVQTCIPKLKGSYAIVIFDITDPRRIIAARSGSPIVVGLGNGENFVASDQLALLHLTQRFMFLEEGDIAEITDKEIHVFNNLGDLVQREIQESNPEQDICEKGPFRHFMQKEIFEQPKALLNTIQGRLSETQVITPSFGTDAASIFSKIEHIQIVACGTSYNAGLTAKYWFESLSRVSCDVEIASEFRYRHFIARPNTLFLTLSQSGETADTLAALRLAKEKDFLCTMSICNVARSSLVRESDIVFLTHAGREIGVASTKAFTTQLIALLMLVTAIGKEKKHLDDKTELSIVQALHALPQHIEEALTFDKEIEKLAKNFTNKQHSLFLGRGALYPIAMEAALKLKEISYIHAEAYAAGELKHGPLALVDAQMPVVVIAPNNDLLDKLKSNIEEVRARGGELILFTDKTTAFQKDKNIKIIALPYVNELIAPIYFTVPMQLLAYHVALIKGTDVDQPRNLAKAVTVE